MNTQPKTKTKTVYPNDKTYFRPGHYIVGKSRGHGLNDLTLNQVSNRRPYILRLNDVVEYKGCTYDPQTRVLTRYFDFNGLLLLSTYPYLQDDLQRIE
jgi:hypothetical protein